MARTLIVSNRVALPGEQRPGGLAIALHAALRERGGVWFGWSGRTDPQAQPVPHRLRHGRVEYRTLDLTPQQADAYYRDFSNRVLWPLLHSRVDLIDYARECSHDYREVNARFARSIAQELRGDDLIWVHDYHHIPLARELRKLGVDNRIGFFLHVPFPPEDLIVALPAHQQVFGELAAYDLIGLQTEQDAAHLKGYLRQYANTRQLDADHWYGADGRRTRIGTFPVGIDTDTIARQAQGAASHPAVERLRASLAGRRLAIGVDRLDYSKGLLERLNAFERYLAHCPAGLTRPTYLQIATPSRGEVPEYRRLRRELDLRAGHINGLHAEPDWTPVRYVNNNYPHNVLTGFYREADVALVTPLRDGMNLVAKEYVASQTGDTPGVLVLSRFAGAACELPEALLVNPHDVEEVADAIATAWDMRLSERRERWRSMMTTLRQHDVTAWRRGFLDALADGHCSREIESPSHDMPAAPTQNKPIWSASSPIVPVSPRLSPTAPNCSLIALASLNPLIRAK
jgi:trehalose 6-phosphate synthase